jgi:spermidine/putrescine transport system substrate-binding protein
MVRSRGHRRAALVVGVLLVAACGGGAPTVAPTAPAGGTAAATTPAPTTAPASPTEILPEDVTGELTVLEWSGYEQEIFWQDFKDKYANANVNFTFGQSDADVYGKMKAGDQADLFHAYTGWLQFYVDEGLVQEIDTSMLTNWDAIPDDFKEIGQIDGKQYFLPWDWGFTSILYRTDRIEGEIDSWAALMDPAYDDHISMWDDGPGAVTVSSYIHGWDETQITDEQLEQIKQEWTAQRELNLSYWAAEPDLVQLIQSGEVWVAYAWQGAYALLLGEEVPVAYADPKEGRNSWVGVYGINSESENVDLAHRFLDEKLAELTGNNLVENFYYGHTNEEVMGGITDETLKEAFSVDDPGILERTNFTPNLTAEQRDAWTQMWTEVKAGG